MTPPSPTSSTRPAWSSPCHSSCVPPAGAASRAALFSVVEKWQGPVLIDEADLGASDMAASVIKMMNVGNERGGTVLRCEGERHEPTAFHVYGPKVFGMREPFDDHATETRCLSFDMQPRATLPQGMSFTFTDAHRAEAAVLRNKLLLWRFRPWHDLTLAPPAQIPCLDP